jgi:hypothetical protein
MGFGAEQNITLKILLNNSTCGYWRQYDQKRSSNIEEPARKILMASIMLKHAFHI